MTQFDTVVPPSRSLPRDALVLAAGMAVANAGNYAFNLVMAFLLGPQAYGALAALLALVLVGSVPGLALQAVVARRTAQPRPAGPAAGDPGPGHGATGGGPGDPDHGGFWPGTARLAIRGGLSLVLLTVLAGPGLVLFLHLDSAVPVAWLALSLAPTPLLFAVQGLLQGRERFGALAAVMVAGAAVKLAVGVALVAAGLGVSGAMAGVAAGGLLAALAGLRLAAPVAQATPGGVDDPTPRAPGSATLPLRGARSGRVGVRRARPGAERPRAERPRAERPRAERPGAGGARGGAAGGGAVRPDPPGGPTWREVGTATTGLLGLFLLANLDVLLARHYLDQAASGRYALGAVVAKIAFWAPQFVVMVVFTRLVGAADPRRLLAGSALVIAGFGGLLAGGLAVADGLGLAVPVLGSGYGDLGPLLPLFAALGTGLALVQLLLFEGIATRDRRMGRAVVAALVAETVLVAGLLHDSVGQVAGAALAVVVLLAAAGWWLLHRRLARHPTPLPAP